MQRTDPIETTLSSILTPARALPAVAAAGQERRHHHAERQPGRAQVPGWASVGRWASVPTKPAKACQTPRRVIRRWNGLRLTLVTVGFAGPSAVKADPF